MQPVPPFWFTQRQGKMEATGPDVYRLTAPNVGEAFIKIHRAENGLWAGELRLKADGPDVGSTEPVYEAPVDAWSAAFELYRVQQIV